MKILVTGANGFVGTALVDRLASTARFSVRMATRRRTTRSSASVEHCETGDLASAFDWRSALETVDAIVHLAGRVHVTRDAASSPLEEFRPVNVSGTLHLARQAGAHGIRRFVYLSSVKVNGERGYFTEADTPAPEDAYGISKCEAERGLREIAAATGMEVVVIRPPLVYGPGVRANFRRLMTVVESGMPLPLGAIHNRRSLVALGNLVDFITTCLEHPRAADEVFFVSDGDDLSTTDLIRRMARAMGRPARLLPVPAPILRATARLLGKQDMARRLLDSLQVDVSKAREMLGWIPPLSVDEGLRRVAEST